jgi:hypothetical protein
VAYEKIENLESTHVELSNALFVQAVAEACEAEGISQERRGVRLDQLAKIEAVVGTTARPFVSVPDLAARWVAEEEKWLASKADGLGGERIAGQLLYRLLVVVLRNQTMVPFTYEVKRLLRKPVVQADVEDFERISSERSKEFLESISAYTHGRAASYLSELHAALTKLPNLSVDYQLRSARHKLLGKDMALLKHAAIGGAIGVSSSLLLGPAIGTWIGNLAGLSGAAATSFGLAFLGGGSIAAGGFGMVGGNIVLGVAFGGARAAQSGLTALQSDILDLTTGQRNLAILLAAGRALRTAGYDRLPAWIHGRILERRMEARRDLGTLESSEDEVRERRKRIEARHDLYQQALEMSKSYDWTTSVDVIRKFRQR